ncbi:MAG: GrdX family protein [Bacillota bacterium]|nr:GrdX family protein [Bacillota bacterium]
MTNLLLTNNPMVLRKYPKSEKITGSLRDVFIKARNYIHQDYQLLMHPLSGSIKPNISPYKSLLLQRNNDFNSKDYSSTILIEEAFTALNKFEPVCLSESNPVLEDFQLVDLSLLESALGSIVSLEKSFIT